MNLNQKIIKPKLGLLELAKSCCAPGILGH